MSTPTLKRLLGTAALALALAACHDSTGPADNAVGELSFTYTGTEAGEFDASGSFDPDANDLPDYGAAFLLGGELVVLASDKLPTGRSNLFIMTVPPTAGTTTCTATTPMSSCLIRAEFLVGVSSDPNQGHGGLYGGYVGAVQVAEIANRRVRGTFSVSLEGTGDTGGAIEIRSGSFDVPFVSTLQLDPNRGLLPPAASPSFSGTLSRP